MKFLKFVVAAVFAVVSGNAYAFHSGGVAECEGCHSMHNYGNTVKGRVEGTGSGPYLLKAGDQSGACLNCHNSADTGPSGYHISTDESKISWTSPTVDAPPVEQTPGGDFAWLKMTRSGSIRKTGFTYDAHESGHNIVAGQFNYVVDPTNAEAPGGTYPSANLACSSCHDPHGRYRRFADGTVSTTGLPIFNSGSYTNSAAPTDGVSAVGVYRILGGVGYQPASLSGSFGFTNPAPDAVSPSTYNAANATIAGAATSSDRVAYGQGMSEWCSNCHQAMHNNSYTSGTPGLVHPAGNGAKLTGAVVANYNAYVSSGIAGTPPVNGYSSLAPFETGMTDRSAASYATLVAFQAAPAIASTSNNVSCMSCHRAHATAFKSATRYFLENEFMTVASSNVAIYDSTITENKINFGLSQAAQQNAYNGRPATVFGPYARNYCNKCHAKD